MISASRRSSGRAATPSRTSRRPQTNLDDAAPVATLHGTAQVVEGRQEPEAKAFKRAAEAVGRFGDDVVTDVAKGELRRLGGALGS
jgi:hypothetical protein